MNQYLLLLPRINQVFRTEAGIVAEKIIAQSLNCDKLYHDLWLWENVSSGKIDTKFWPEKLSLFYIGLGDLYWEQQ